LIISQVHKFIYNHSKSTVRNTVDYSGQEKLFGKTSTRGPSGPLRRTIRDTKVSLGQEHCINASQHYGLSDGEASAVRDQARIVQRRSEHHPRPSVDCPASGADRPIMKNQKNPKVTGSVKM
jgi:hypothetical protein